MRQFRAAAAVISRRHVVASRNRIVCCVIVIVVLILILWFLNKPKPINIEDTMDEPGQPTADLPRRRNSIRGGDDNGNSRDVQPRRKSAAARRVDVAEHVATPGDVEHIKAICEQSVPPELLRHVMSIDHSGNRNGGAGENQMRRPRSLIFVGDSHALRMFRWVGLMLYFGNQLRAESSDLVGEYFPINLDQGVTSSPETMRLNLIPNAARLISVQFRRGTFLDDAASAIEKLNEEVTFARRNQDDNIVLQKDAIASANRNPKNMDVLLYLSVGNWDILRPEQHRHGFTLDTVHDDLVARFSSLQEKLKAKMEAEEHREEQVGIGVIVDHEQRDLLRARRLQDDAQRALSEAADFALEKTMPRWKQSCGLVHDAAKAALNPARSDITGEAGGMSDGASRILWRWSSPPNCTADRFNPPRAKISLSKLCPFIAGNFWHDRYFEAVKEIVRQGKGSDQDPAAVKKRPAFELYEQVRSDGRSDMGVGCASKADGVHPSHFCAAREAGAALLKSLS